MRIFRYANGRLNHTEPLQSLLYSEFVSHMDENVSTPATKLADGFEYYSRMEKGQEYAVHCRRSKSEAPQVWLNENELAMGSQNYLGCIHLSERSLQTPPSFIWALFGILQTTRL